MRRSFPDGKPIDVTDVERIKPLEIRVDAAGHEYRAERGSPRAMCFRCERKAGQQRRDARALVARAHLGDVAYQYRLHQAAELIRQYEESQNRKPAPGPKPRRPRSV